MNKHLKITSLIIFGGCLFSLAGCMSPDIDFLNKNLGVQLPKGYKIIRASPDIGLDVNDIFVFQFDSTDCRELERQIINTPLYNIAGPAEFDSLSKEKKLNLLRILAGHELTSYWIRSGSTYWFDGDSLFMNTHDDIIRALFPNHIVLPNRKPDEHYDREDGTPAWMVRAVFDTKKRTLFYRYIYP